jgi:hypothetical protein
MRIRMQDPDPNIAIRGIVDRKTIGANERV